ncbi:thiopeptide-type bacteriocin biosynthesis protein [Luteibaculum oceani]|uniref:Thiopeptide-type bacteriocin biosynthesis domain-containing protein n=1 Tax=Luteibaculum oceani TaxID=1294296 RepID=A0A5C6VJT0_9FLAO|nr:thiopeptide-type bacteriocin biosynthesis protein [Luteibaculum oceani]TXC85240.1 hypothetical protein FRX97_01045 [Luteibaculum oceani]
MSKDNAKWRAAHLYYGEPWETMMREFLFPWIKNHIEEGVEPYFFIRYWERGPHVRFRFKVSDNRFSGLSKKLENDFYSYCTQNPSDFSFYGMKPEDLAKISADWYPNNSLQWIAYEPETARYGGPATLPICEDQFMNCSRTCLSIIEEDIDWSYTDSLTSSIQQHVLFLRAVGFDKERAQLFLHFVFLSWYPRASENWNALSTDEQKKERDRIVKAFDDQFALQKDQLIPFINTLWNASEEEFEDILEPYMIQWYTLSRETKEKLQTAQKNGELQDPGWIRTVKGIQVDTEEAALWALYSSFVHMTNNRIGVQNKDEAYLAHLISKTLDQIG